MLTLPVGILNHLNYTQSPAAFASCHGADVPGVAPSLDIDYTKLHKSGCDQSSLSQDLYLLSLDLCRANELQEDSGESNSAAFTRDHVR